jgi:AbrB family looped-hinge helix DNA binding protein
MPYGKINGMRLTLDKSGRVVLPKPLRQRLGLRAGATLEVAEAAGGLLLRPVSQQPSMVEHSGFLVHTGQVTSPGDWQRFLEDLEQERLHDILGQY